LIRPGTRSQAASAQIFIEKILVVKHFVDFLKTIDPLLVGAKGRKTGGRPATSPRLPHFSESRTYSANAHPIVEHIAAIQVVEGRSRFWPTHTSAPPHFAGHCHPRGRFSTAATNSVAVCWIHGRRVVRLDLLA
jgi:hypothetical protein